MAQEPLKGAVVSAQERAVVFDGALRVVERARPKPEADEVLIRLRVAGICNTDLELMAGYQDFSGVLGHEFVGEVVDGAQGWMGRRVVGRINVGCQHCLMCQRGNPEHCENRRVLGIAGYDGTFADHFRLVTRNLLVVPDSVPDEVAVFTEPLAAACQIVEQVHFRPTDRVVLIGAGKLGLLAAQVLRHTGVDLSVVVRRDRPAALLAQWNIPAVRRNMLADHRADVVVDCTGTSQGFQIALELVRPRGTIVLKSTYAGIPQADLTRLVVNEVTLVGSRCGPFEPALRLLEQGMVHVEPLIEARYGLDDVQQAIEQASKPGALKVLLVP